MAGERRRIDLPISLLSNHAGMSLAIEVIHGRKPGPTLFVSGAVHGDEIIGVEIVRRVRKEASLRNLAGTLLLIPIVNAFGFVGLSRYLPDRRDLNRSFPGTPGGSLASQLAHLFMREIVDRSDYGIDLHSGASHRENLPQIRAKLDDTRIRKLASAFGAPVVLNSQLRDGSLREAAQERGCAMLLYEGGEALRFDETAIRVGVRGVMNVMRALEMSPARLSQKTRTPVFSAKTGWTRAPIGGVMRCKTALGSIVAEDDVLAVISDPFGVTEEEVRAARGGVVIGKTNLPVVNRGDALFHVAEVGDPARADEMIGSMDADLEDTDWVERDIVI
ncbi:MAG: succinylglutamate desuccinylase/aspartoacylase family protein [Parvularculaceae bacterium]